MEFSFHFAYPIVFFVALFAVFFVAWLRLKRRQPVYRYSIAEVLKNGGCAYRNYYKKILFLLRFFTLSLLAFLLARPQLVDTTSKVTVEGINIILVLDVSGSMQLVDSDNEPARIESAKEEAIRFIKARDNDAIGLVLFGNGAVSRCPLTLDKNILTSIVDDTHVGVIDYTGTLLSTAIITAANRLKSEKSKSNVMILLTDGEPSPGDKDPALAIEVAKKLGIKVYTIGVGSDEDKVFMHSFHGPMRIPKINAELLTRIANETGGQFFLAKNQQDMRLIYDTIDKLEKTEDETPIYKRYYDIFMPFLWVVFACLILELMVSLFWFGL